MSKLGHAFNMLVRFEIELWNAVDARLKADVDLPLVYFEPMMVINRTPGCRVFDIASELGITTGGASKLVDRIEARGLSRRRANPDDRRSSLLELTPAGRRLLARAERSFDDELAVRFGRISDRAAEQFVATLTRLRTSGLQLDVAADTA
jgi:DNA-binding MarR family transcriptional regulator